VYFTWVVHDFGSADRFHSLLHAIEEEDVQNRIEINIYLTAKIKEDDVTNITVQDVGADKAITSLRAPTHFGRRTGIAFSRASLANIPKWMWAYSSADLPCSLVSCIRYATHTQPLEASCS